MRLVLAPLLLALLALRAESSNVFQIDASDFLGVSEEAKGEPPIMSPSPGTGLIQDE